MKNIDGLIVLVATLFVTIMYFTVMTAKVNNHADYETIAKW